MQKKSNDELIIFIIEAQLINLYWIKKIINKA